MTSEQEKKVAKVMREFESGKLRSSSGETVTSRQQALAIAYSEAGISGKDQ
ncbi:coil containing protein [Vibrio phage vB_VpP_1]|nr:coil containing protein [Vibrio phage vB_VpP_1]